MRKVTKAQFRDLYFRLGGGEAAGWGAAYWDKFFGDDARADMTYLAEEPVTACHTRMMIVTDYDTRQHRLFFMTEEDEENFFDSP
jgi:hypothetical protein